eukprot:7969563-Karenia_brevis.AAC.1
MSVMTTMLMTMMEELMTHACASCNTSPSSPGGQLASVGAAPQTLVCLPGPFSDSPSRAMNPCAW